MEQKVPFFFFWSVCFISKLENLASFLRREGGKSARSHGGAHPEKHLGTGHGTPSHRSAPEACGGLCGWTRGVAEDCTPEKLISPDFTRWCNLGACFGNHRLCKFPGIKQPAQPTKARRKSPPDKRPASFPPLPFMTCQGKQPPGSGTFKLGAEDTSISPQTSGPSLEESTPPPL